MTVLRLDYLTRVYSSSMGDGLRRLLARAPASGRCSVGFFHFSPASVINLVQPGLRDFALLLANHLTQAGRFSAHAVGREERVQRPVVRIGDEVRPELLERRELDGADHVDLGLGQIRGNVHLVRGQAEHLLHERESS